MAKQLRNSDSQAQARNDETQISTITESSASSTEDKEFTVDDLKALAIKLTPAARNVVIVFFKRRHLFQICGKQLAGVSCNDVIKAILEDKLTNMSDEQIRCSLVLWRNMGALGKLAFTLVLEASRLFTTESRLFYEIMRETGGISDEPPTGFFRGEFIGVGSEAGAERPMAAAGSSPTDIWTGSNSRLQLQLVDDVERTSVSLSYEDLGKRLNDEFVQLSFEDRLRIAAESIPNASQRRAIRATLRDVHMENMATRQAAEDALTRDLNIRNSCSRSLQRGLGIHRSPRAPITISSLDDHNIRSFKHAFLAVPDNVCERSVELTSKHTLVFQLRLRPFQVVDDVNARRDSNGSASSNRQKLGRFLQLFDAYLAMTLHDIGIGVDMHQVFFERLAVNMEYGEKMRNAGGQKHTEETDLLER